jgi:glutamate-1-semialdehyde 2,1-aminomutase
MAQSRSAELFDRALRVMPGGNTRTTVFYPPHPRYVARGEGARVYDVDGNVYIDAINNFTALIHGHNHPGIIAAIQAQLGRGTSFGMPTESEIALAELICGRVSSVDRIRFTNSGTEAVMSAIKAARAFTERTKIVKCEGAYHGTYDVAEVSECPAVENWGPAHRPASVATARGTPPSTLSEVIVIPFNDVAAASDIIRASGNDIAAILVDPMPNRAGLVPATGAFLKILRGLASEVGAVLIFDEVIAFRLGYHGAQHRFEVSPDLTCFGKIIGGGLPIGAFGGRADIMALFDPRRGQPVVPHGGTFTANPMTMSAGLAAMEMLDEDAFARLEEIGDALAQKLQAALASAGVAGQVTGLGSLRRIHLADIEVKNYRSMQQAAGGGQKLKAVQRAMLDEGALISPTGLIALSSVITDEDIAAIVAAFDSALDRCRDMLDAT